MKYFLVFLLLVFGCVSQSTPLKNTTSILSKNYPLNNTTIVLVLNESHNQSSLTYADFLRAKIQVNELGGFFCGFRFSKNQSLPADCSITYASLDLNRTIEVVKCAWDSEIDKECLEKTDTKTNISNSINMHSTA